MSVVRSLWQSGRADNAVFLADYAINPLGVRNEASITEVVNNWLERAARISDILVIACNTLSIRYHQLHQSIALAAGPATVISMVDCVAAMAREAADAAAGRKILVIGTEFTASQGLYVDVLGRAIPGARVQTIAATELESKIARFKKWDGPGDTSLTSELRHAIAATDFAVLACTCFPMVQADLQVLFPDVVFLDPGAYCPALLKGNSQECGKALSLAVTGDVVAPEHVLEYARTYLDAGEEIALSSPRSI